MLWAEMKSLDYYSSRRLLRREPTSPQEISDILSVVDRDLEECRKDDISLDWRFNIAYNAGLQLCKLVLRASGYRTSSRSPAHHLTISCLPLIMGPSQQERADFLDSCRSVRNRIEYDVAGTVREEDVLDLIEEAENLRHDVIGWLRRKHPELHF